MLKYYDLTTEDLNVTKSRTLKSININELTRNDNDNDNNDKLYDDPFLTWIEKVNEAKNYFQNNDFKSSQIAIGNLKKIANIGLSKMEKYFQDILNQQTNKHRLHINNFLNYTLPNNWLSRGINVPIFCNKGILKTKNLVRDFNVFGNSLNDELLYIQKSIVNILSNVAIKIEATSHMHFDDDTDKLDVLIIKPRSRLLIDFLTGLNDEILLTMIHYEHYINNTAIHNNDNELDIKSDTETKEDINNNNNNTGKLTADALRQLENKENTSEYNSDNSDHDHIIVLDQKMDDNIIKDNIRIKNVTHPIILLIHLSLSLFQMEKFLCGNILDYTSKGESKEEFDKFFCDLLKDPINFIIKKINVEILYINMDNNNNDDDIKLYANKNVIKIDDDFKNNEQKMLCYEVAKEVLNSNQFNKNNIYIKLDLIRCWNKLSREFKKLLNESNELNDNIRETPLTRLTELFKSLRYNIKDELQSRLSMIINNDTKIRHDGGYHPLTIETISFMKRLCAFKEVIFKLYKDDTLDSISLRMKHATTVKVPKKARLKPARSANDLSKAKSTNDTDINADNDRYTLKTYLKQILNNLIKNIELKSDQYETKGNKILQILFKLNNINYCVLNISEYFNLETEIGKDRIEELKITINKLKNQYNTYSWKKVLENIDFKKGDKSKITTKKDNLTNNEKKPIKRRYTGFNNEFRRQCELQKSYSIPNNDLKQEIIKNNIGTIVPKYREFCKRFKDVNFSLKKKTQYEIYDDNAVSKMLQGFFSN